MRMTTDSRVETDSMGNMRVPAAAYYGAQTARAVENFPISNLRFGRRFLRALGLIKKHAARTNARLGLLDKGVAEAIEAAAAEVIGGKFDAEFVVDVFQTGSGTSTNMNANEVIANRASELRGGRLGDKAIHPNDHVNRGQSSNDVIPSAIHLAALEGLHGELLPSLGILQQALEAKAKDFAEVLKIGRTHLQDATPIRLGQEFAGFARQIELNIERLHTVLPHLGELALGGTAVGTGLNTHADFATLTIAGIAAETGLDLREARNHFTAQGSIDSLVETSGALKTLAISLVKIANDIRWLGSGPRCGLGELKIPATQPGSSIMPGKVNPVIPEMVIQVAAQVIGCDAAIAFSGTQGFLELNTMLPVTGYNLLLMIELLNHASRTFALRCISGLQADRERCEAAIEQSLAMCTALAPEIGYDKAAHIAKVAYETGQTVRKIASEISGISPARLAELLDPANQAGRPPEGGVSLPG
jgi:fumarate hydratase class II